MSQRLHNLTKWFWCLLVLYSGPNWNPVRCVSVRSPPSNPSTIESQAKFFQYRHLPTADDYDQGHRLGSERHFTERHERSRPATGLFSAKVRWGDKKGGYGEHYWDLNHAGNAGDHGNDGYDDDGSYHNRDSGDTYDEPNEQSPNYDTTNYDAEKSSHQLDFGREKRAPKKIRIEKSDTKEESEEDDEEEEKPQVRQRPARKQKEQKETLTKNNEDEDEENQEDYRKPVKQRRQQKQQQLTDNTEESKPTKEKNHIVLVVDEKEKQEKPVQRVQPVQPVRYVSKQPEPKVFAPYEGGAGVRQHYQAETAFAASVPRLFLEPATGHVVDRATGQAYVLQPIIRDPTYS